MLAAQGVPDAAGVRSTVWKLLLGYLPNDRSLWEQDLAKKRSQYSDLKDEFLTNPDERRIRAAVGAAPTGRPWLAVACSGNQDK
ncbi:unnamed protein product [Urochloa humidicola]